MSDPRRQLGALAEDLVAERLSAAGWHLIERNARTRQGEIDLVAGDRGCLVFVEVKAGRSGIRHGAVRPAHAVGPQKQLRLRRLAREWLSSHRPPFNFREIRFDVVGVSFDRDGRLVDYEHIEAAF